MEKTDTLRQRGPLWMNNWFFQLLFSYLPLFLIVLALVFTSFLFTYSERNKNELQIVSDYINRSIMQSLDNRLKAIFLQTSSEMNADNPIMEFFREDSVGDPVISYRLMTRLQEIKNATPLIDSLYAVRLSDNTVVGNEGITSVDNYPDRDFIAKLRREPYKTGWSSVRSVEARNGSVKHVVTLVRRGFPLASGSGILILNIKLSTLGDYIAELTGSNYPYVRIEDTDGQSIVGTAKGGTNAALVESVSSYTGWKYSIHWLDRNAPFVYNTIPKLWITLMVVTSLFGIIGVVYVTYRNYRPVRAIASMIDEFTRKEADRIAARSANEMKYIQNVIHTLIDRSLESRELVELNYFRDMLSGTKRSAGKWKSVHNRLNAVAADSRFTVIAIEIDHYGQFVQTYSQRDQDLMKYVLKSMVQELLQSHRLANWAEWTTSRRLACIVVQPADIGEDARALYAQIVEWVRSNLQYTITIGVGHDVLHADELNDSHEAALRAVQYKTTRGLDRVILAEETADAASVPIGRYYAHVRSVAAALRGTRQEVQDRLRSLFDAMRGEEINQESLRQIMKDFALQINQELSAVSDPNAEPFLFGAYRPDEAETVEEAEQICGELAEAACAFMENVRESRLHRAQLEQIRSYVIRHFANPDLSLDLLSGKFELSSKYISKLFKDEFGVNFVDFVIHLRIDHACKLLTDTEYSIQEIAEMSGYSNPISFRRMFKKITKLTPGEYRLRKSG